MRTDVENPLREWLPNANWYISTRWGCEWSGITPYIFLHSRGILCVTERVWALLSSHSRKQNSGKLKLIELDGFESFAQNLEKDAPNRFKEWYRDPALGDSRGTQNDWRSLHRSASTRQPGLLGSSSSLGLAMPFSTILYALSQHRAMILRGGPFAAHRIARSSPRAPSAPLLRPCQVQRACAGGRKAAARLEEARQRALPQAAETPQKPHDRDMRV
eukprot:gene86-biopygen26